METVPCPLELPTWASKDGPGTRKTLELPFRTHNWVKGVAVAWCHQPLGAPGLSSWPGRCSHAYLPPHTPGSLYSGAAWVPDAQALCVRGSLSCPSPAPAIPASSGGDGAYSDHPHPGTRGPHQGTGEFPVSIPSSFQNNLLILSVCFLME